MPSFSRDLEKALHRALSLARDKSLEFATLEHLLLALTDDRDTIAVLNGCDVDIEALKEDLTDFVNEELDSLIIAGGQDARPTAAFQRVIQRAVIHVQSSGRKEVTGANVLVAIFAERESHASYFLEQQDMSRLDAINFINHGITKSGPYESPFESLEAVVHFPYGQEIDEILAKATKTAKIAGHVSVLPEHVLRHMIEAPVDPEVAKWVGGTREELRETLNAHLIALPQSDGSIRSTPDISDSVHNALRAVLVKAAVEGRDELQQIEVFQALLAVSIAAEVKETKSSTGPSKNAKAKPDRAGLAPPAAVKVRKSRPVSDRFVFISYASDDRPLVGTIIKLLEYRGIKVWWDQMIPASETWRDAIDSALDQCGAHLVIWTKTSVKSNPVREEAGRGLKARRLIQVLLDEGKLPFGFSEHQYIKLPGWDGITVSTAVERLVQAIIDTLSPPTTQQLKTRLIKSGATDATIVNGRVAVVDAPAGAEPPNRNPEELNERMRAQRSLAEAILTVLSDERGNNLPVAIPRCIRRYQQALAEARPCWYSLEDAMSTINHCTRQYSDEPWPETTRHDVDRLHERHRQLEDLVRPRQLPGSSSAPATADIGPSITEAKIAPAPIESALEATKAGIEAGEEAQLLDPSVSRAAAHFSGRLEDAMLEAGASENSIERRLEGAAAGLRGLGAVLASVTKVLREGMKTQSIKSTPMANSVIETLNKALESILKFFRP